jgi:uncharacterized membrane protein YfcA
MQTVIPIAKSGLPELEPQTKNSVLIANEETVIHTLRFISPGITQQIAVFATKPGIELKKICYQHDLLLFESKFSVEQSTGYEKIIIVNNDLKNAVTFTGGGHKTWKEIKRLLNGNKQDEEKKWKRVATWLVISFALMITGHLILSELPIPPFAELITRIKPYFNSQFLFFVAAGFAAQMVDGALSMGYGVTSATCLISIGVPPVSSSAAIHTSEIFTTGISGYSHYKFGNVNKKLFRHLVIPGVISAVAGALLLVFLGEKAGKWLMPLIAFYAMFLGIKILLKAFQAKKTGTKVKRIGWLAGIGGFLDSFGGGGWGPIVTSSLVAKGRDPKYTVGTVCLTEFFVTLASATTFFLTVGVQHLNIVLGLIIGGSIAAPIAARLTGRIPKKKMMIAVGIMVIIWSLRMVLKSFF